MWGDGGWGGFGGEWGIENVSAIVLFLVYLDAVIV